MIGSYSYQTLTDENDTRFHLEKFPAGMRELFCFSDEQKAMFEVLVSAFRPIHEHFKSHPALEGLRVDCAIGGGAIRDLLMGKPELITDLDVYITIQTDKINRLDRDDERVYYTKILQRAKELNLITSQFIASDKPHHVYHATNAQGEAITDLSANQICFILLKHVLKDFTPIEQEFMSNVKKKSGEQVYEHNDISGVIKTNMQFQTDFIFLMNSMPAHFIEEHFDYNLCKVGLQMQELNLFSAEFYPQAMPYFIVSDTFIKDAQNKTLSYYTECLDNSVVEASVRKHLPKLLNKYPEFNVVLEGAVEEHEIILREYLLRRKLEAQTTQPAKRSALRKI